MPKVIGKKQFTPYKEFSKGTSYHFLLFAAIFFLGRQDSKAPRLAKRFNRGLSVSLFAAIFFRPPRREGSKTRQEVQCRSLGFFVCGNFF
jgi:hypothetical protein